jgi:hypothetical protein
MEEGKKVVATISREQFQELEEVRSRGIWMVKAIAPFYPATRSVKYYRDHVEVSSPKDLSWAFDLALSHLGEEWKDTATADLEIRKEGNQVRAEVRAYYFDIKKGNQGKGRVKSVRVLVGRVALVPQEG